MVTFGQKKPASHGFAVMLALPVARHEPAVHGEHAAALARSVVEETEEIDAEIVPVHAPVQGFAESVAMVMVLAATPEPESVAPTTIEPDATAVMVSAVPVTDPIATAAEL